MKWGVRRYQNYDGSYTQAGLKRYNEAMAKYEKAEKAENAAKARYAGTRHSGYSTTTGDRINNNDPRSYKAEKEAWKQARKERKAAKKEVEKHYKHLKQDKLADEGKKLYGKGKTITANDNRDMKLSGGGILLYGAGQYAVNNSASLGKKFLNSYDYSGAIQKAGGVATVAGIGLSVLGIGSQIVSHNRNKKLRAYYSHTSKY